MLNDIINDNNIVTLIIIIEVYHSRISNLYNIYHGTGNDNSCYSYGKY